MLQFAVTFQWHSRPLHRKGRIKYTSVVFAAHDMTEAYRLARTDGLQRFPRHRWHVSACIQLPQPSPIISGPFTAQPL